MKFATFTKLASASLAALFAVALVGCGSDNNLTLTQGNWSIAATSNNNLARQNRKKHTGNLKNNSPISEADIYIGGNITQTGTNIAGTMYIVDNLSNCLTANNGVPFTGTVKGTQVTITSPSLNGAVITVLASGTTTSTTTSLTGTYSVAGGCANGDSGTVTANVVAPIDGTWNGSLSNCTAGVNGCSNATISVAMTQATTASSDGTFAITGTVTYTNSCLVSGTITGASIAGQFVVIDADTVDQSSNAGSFVYGLSLVDSPTAPANMNGPYDASNQCDVSQNLTLSLQ